MHANQDGKPHTGIASVLAAVLVGCVVFGVAAFTAADSAAASSHQNKEEAFFANKGYRNLGRFFDLLDPFGTRAEMLERQAEERRAEEVRIQHERRRGRQGEPVYFFYIPGTDIPDRGHENVGGGH